MQGAAAGRRGTGGSESVSVTYGAAYTAWWQEFPPPNDSSGSLGRFALPQSGLGMGRLGFSTSPTSSILQADPVNQVCCYSVFSLICSLAIACGKPLQQSLSLVVNTGLSICCKWLCMLEKLCFCSECPIWSMSRQGAERP